MSSGAEITGSFISISSHFLLAFILAKITSGDSNTLAPPKEKYHATILSATAKGKTILLLFFLLLFFFLLLLTRFHTR